MPSADAWCRAPELATTPEVLSVHHWQLCALLRDQLIGLFGACCHVEAR